ncbi:hypothetical protein G7Y89_g2063 [Cudoniella acicularis]|uniref:Zn(2)-C6 fungal-type domain-containing protein n=1 Tax=Cudoniella acicularis TaxID=354080 RepID=A0A8H4W8Z1_9HELO|nr:hypothetical protein G7Y89_g2063 [Cudoniella acicularis]
MPEPLPVGKKVTSCDQCAHTKKRCDRKVPCSTCAGKHHTCTYERQMSSSKQTILTSQVEASHSLVDEEYASDLEINYDFEYLTDADWLELDWNGQFPMQVLGNAPSQNERKSQTLPHPSNSCQLQLSYNPISISESTSFQPSFDFLLNFTRASGLKAIFNYKRCRSPRAATCHVSQQQPPHHDESTFEPIIPRSRKSCSRRTSGANVMASQHRVSLVSLIESLDDPLFGQTKAIWDSFRISRIRSSQIALQSVNDPDRADERCLQFFCPENLRRFTRLFWDEWYPHCPIIHKPTFNVYSAPVTLLVPMAVIGACMSDSAEEVSRAKEWLEFGEEIVFSSAILSAEPVERAASDIDIPPLRVIQAAYITCILLNWEGSDTMKRRVRHHHFAAVVSAVREIGVASSNHYPLDFVNACNFSWHQFIEREETIRTFTYVFLLDTAFVIFNNTPPRMVLHEMNLEMTTSESCFQADNAADCYTQWHAHLSQHFAHPGSTALFLGEAISILMGDNYDAHAIRFANLSTLSLFTLVAGLHTVVFQQLSLFSCLPTSLQPVRAALSRWQSLWPLRSDSIHIHPHPNDAMTMPRDAWQDTGFIGQAQEFAWLVVARLDRVEGETRVLGDAGELRQDPASPMAEAASPGRLDDTSMTVVTDLMLSLTVGGG